MSKESIVCDTHLQIHTFRRLPTPPELLNCDVLVFSVQIVVFVCLLLLHVLNNELQIKKMNNIKSINFLLHGIADRLQKNHFFVIKSKDI